MPVWLQLIAALSAAAASGVMGAALVPFLRRLRFCEPEKPAPQKKDAAAGEKLLPTMCGLLLAFGILTGMVLGVTLFREFSGTDITGQSFRTQSLVLICVLAHGLLMTAAGFITDLLTVRHRLRYRIRPLLLMGVVLAVTAGTLYPLFREHPERLLLSIPVVLCWQCVRHTAQETDGIGVTLQVVQLPAVVILLLSQGQEMTALYPLTALGACMGCMVWNLPPAKCRLGCTGSYLIGSIVPTLCAALGLWKLLVLYMIVYGVDLAPLLRKHDGRRMTLLSRMEEAGMAPWKRLALLAGFALLCIVPALPL